MSRFSPSGTRKPFFLASASWAFASAGRFVSSSTTARLLFASPRSGFVLSAARYAVSASAIWLLRK